MSIAPEKLARLRSFLGGLPADIAARLAVLVEADRREPGSTFPHDVILETLRPRPSPSNDNGTADTPAGAGLNLSEVDELARAANLNLREDQVNLVEVVAVLLERAPYEIARALPARARGSFGCTPVADFSRQVPCDTVENAIRYAKLMAASRTDPRVARLATILAGVARTTFGRLRSYADGVVREKRAADGSGAGIIDQRFATAIALTEILFSRAEADALRRRAQTAELRAS